MPRKRSSIERLALLSAALEGLQLQKQRLDEQIAEVRSLLEKTTGRRGRPHNSSNTDSTKTRPSTKRPAGRLSAAARKRIAAAQKRRWAEYRKSAGKPE